MLDTDALRQHFSYLRGTLELRVAREGGPQGGKEKNLQPRPRLFVDNTASSQVPTEVIEQVAAALLDYANVHRCEYDASQVTTERFEAVYNTAANLVNARSWREIILGRNATEMLNLVMRVLEYEFRNGDNIVLTMLEHNSNYVPWYSLQKNLEKVGKVVEIRLVPFDKKTGVLEGGRGGLESAIDARTKVVSITGASNFMGVKPDLKAVAALAHASTYAQPYGREGSYFVVDGAQLVPGSPVDVQASDVDFLAWSFHKMLIPLGVGGLYARQEIMEQAEPFLYGGDMIEEVKPGQVKYKPLPWKYTAGTPNILGTIAAGAGMSFLINAGLGNFSADGKKEADFVGKQIETEVLMHTPRGDFEGKYAVPDQYHGLFRTYLAEHPDRAVALRDPAQRLQRTQRAVHTAMAAVQEHEQELTQYAIDGLSRIPGVEVYGPLDAQKRTGLIAFNIEGIHPQAVAFQLNQRGVEVRNGNHCASLAHYALDIEGTVRMSFYVYNTRDEVDAAVKAVAEIAQKRE